MSAEPDNVLRPVNWELRQHLNKADKFVKHFLGTMRCSRCGNECQVLMEAPLWAAHPPAGTCAVGDCKGNCLFIAPLDYEHGEDFLYTVINPADR